MDTDINGKVVTETDPAKRQALVTSSWQDKRNEMKQVCSHCHTPNYVDSFYKQYDDFVITTMRSLPSHQKDHGRADGSESHHQDAV